MTDGHEHGHEHGAPEVMTSGAAVMLDIGGEIGAVIVYLGDQTVGPELDIRPAGDDAGRFHTGVHHQVVDGAATPVAVFPEVRTGSYELLDQHGQPFAEVAAVGGEVCTLDLRTVSHRTAAAASQP